MPLNLGLGLRSKFKRFSEEAGYLRQNIFGRAPFSLKSPERVNVCFFEPHEMTVGDRLVLYALIRGLKPRRVLEIGVRYGGSARIMSNAMEDNGVGRIVGLDPDVTNFRPSPAQLHGRYTLMQGYSPEDTPKAIEALGGSADFVMIDAVHTYSAAKQDYDGVAPFLEPYAHVAFHDSFHQGVDGAVGEILAADDTLTDAGMISKNLKPDTPNSYCGIRLLRRGQISLEEAIRQDCEVTGRPVPEFSRDHWDRDIYTDRIGNPLGRR